MNSSLKNNSSGFQCGDKEFKMLFDNSFKYESKEFEFNDEIFFINSDSNSDNYTRKNSASGHDLITQFLKMQGNEI